MPALIVHGGAGADPLDGPEELRRGIRESVGAGWRALDAGGSALDAVEAAVRSLEDHPRFNAGRGSVLTAVGTVETDASIMEGDTLRNGAVAAVSGVRNPIVLARRILDDGHHSFYAGPGARALASTLGVPLCDPDELVTEHQRRRLAGLQVGTSSQAGTVGAVALDRHGTIAAATSTGGTAGKLPGRVGDSPLIGCGTYAESTLGGVSCTGDGEAIIRVTLARRTMEILKTVGDPTHACEVALSVLVEEGRGQGGLILVDWRGRMGWARSTPMMPVGLMSPGRADPEVPF
ncbi:MAG TPA: isoaspartyl peptidase/L-asparaginase [Methylomirabilota bacterium]|nr:isoaspartyl peptidase/L-asparaginase [Methylomirabilota bacterium]